MQHLHITMDELTKYASYGGKMCEETGYFVVVVIYNLFLKKVCFSGALQFECVLSLHEYTDICIFRSQHIFLSGHSRSLMYVRYNS